MDSHWRRHSRKDKVTLLIGTFAQTMENDLTDLSRTISHALRHAPWLYELEPDEEGWVEINTLVTSLRESSECWRGLTEAQIVEMIRCSPKRRHEVSGHRIRALYGHSLPGRVTKAPSEPPEHLYHGTSPAVEAAIRKSGLLPMGRQYVHLSVDEATAREVGRRKAAQPLILVVNAHEAWKRGVMFYPGGEKVWLAVSVPPGSIVFPQR